MKDSGLHGGVVVTQKQQKALQLISDAGYVTAGWFATQMGYDGHRVKGRTGAAVLKRLQALGWVQVWDEWYGSAYATTAKLTPAGEQALALAATVAQESTEVSEPPQLLACEAEGERK